MGRRRAQRPDRLFRLRIVQRNTAGALVGQGQGVPVEVFRARPDDGTSYGIIGA